MALTKKRIGVHVGVARSDDHRSLGDSGGMHRVEHMREQGAAGDLVQHLRPLRVHAGTLAGGEHDCEAAAVSHHVSSVARPRTTPNFDPANAE